MEVSILLVEDDESIGKTVYCSLASSGYKILVADSVREAIELLQNNQYDIVITDKNIRGLGGAKEGGLELLRHIKTNLPDTEVIIITDFSSKESSTGVIKLGAFDYLIKPFTANELKEKIDEAAEYKASIDQKKFLSSYMTIHNKIVNLFERQDHLSREEIHDALTAIKTKIGSLLNAQQKFAKIALEQKEALATIQRYVEQLDSNVPQADYAYGLIKKIYNESNKVIKPVLHFKPI